MTCKDEYLKELRESKRRTEELQAEVEKAHDMVRRRDNKLAKKSSQLADLRRTSTVARQRDQIREQGQVIEGLKAAREQDAEKIAELEQEITRLHSLYFAEREAHNTRTRGGA